MPEARWAFRWFLGAVGVVLVLTVIVLVLALPR